MKITSGENTSLSFKIIDNQQKANVIQKLTNSALTNTMSEADYKFLKENISEVKGMRALDKDTALVGILKSLNPQADFKPLIDKLKVSSQPDFKGRVNEIGNILGVIKDDTEKVSKSLQGTGESIALVSEAIKTNDPKEFKANISKANRINIASARTLESIHKTPAEVIGKLTGDINTLSKKDNFSDNDITKIKEISKKINDVINKVKTDSVKTDMLDNPKLRAIEITVGKSIIPLISKLPLDKRMEVFKDISSNGFSLHNCAIGYLEQKSSEHSQLAPDNPKLVKLKNNEKLYKDSLVEMSVKALDDKKVSLGIPDNVLQAKKDFISKNTVLAKALISSDSIGQIPHVDLHPGSWGLFLHQPVKLDDIDKIKDGTSLEYSKTPSGNNGLHFYTTNGNNRRSFQRVVDTQGNMMTFSTKGNGIDLTADREKIKIVGLLDTPLQQVEKRRELKNDIANLKEAILDPDNRFEDIKNTISKISDSALQYIDTKVNLSNLNSTLKYVSENPLKELTGFRAAVIQGVPGNNTKEKLMNVIGSLVDDMEKQIDNKLFVFADSPASGFDSHKTVGFADISVADVDFKAIDRKYRVLKEMSSENPIYKPLEKAFIQPVFVMGMAKTSTNMEALTSGVKNQSSGNYITQIVTASEGETSLRLRRTHGADDYRLGDQEQETNEFIRVTEKQGLVAPDRVTADIGENDTNKAKAVFTMSYNLIGSLGLFIKDGDSSGGAGAGDSFEARNVSNGSVRDEDEWEGTQIRKNGDTLITNVSNDLLDVYNTMSKIPETVGLNAPNSNLVKDLNKTRGLIKNFKESLFGEAGGAFQFSPDSDLPAKMSAMIDTLSNGSVENKQEIMGAILKDMKVDFNNGNIQEKFDSHISVLKGKPDNIDDANRTFKSSFRVLASKYFTSELNKQDVRSDITSVFSKMFSSVAS